MLDQLKQLNQLRKLRPQAKKLQQQLAEVTETVEEGDWKVKVSADQKVIYIEQNGESQEPLAKAINKAFKEVQKKAAKRMIEEGGGLEGLLGGMK